MNQLTPSSTLRVKLSFASSGIAQGVVSNGVSYFLLIYYSQVLGLDPALAGLAMMISLFVDAVSDPLVGSWSDRTRHKWGRRHPFLFASVIPSAACYYLLWVPPDLDQTGLFVYLLCLTVALRLSLSIHAVPFNALLPEITADYEARTRLMSYSYSGAWFMGTVLAVLMYAYWLADAPDSVPGSGVLRVSGYIDAGFVSAVVALVCLVIAALGTFPNRQLAATMPRETVSLGMVFRQSLKTLNDRNFLAMVVSGLASALAAGTATALWAYIQPYFWGFDSEQTSALLAAQLLSAIAAFAVTPRVTAGREKRDVLIGVSAMSILVGSGPVVLALMGWFPAVGSLGLFYTMVVMGVIQVMLIVMTSTLTASMIADIVESRALQTERREEGLLFSVISFVNKAASGAGVWAGGLILAFIAFPVDTVSAAVPSATVTKLGWLYGPTLAVFYVISIVALMSYTLNRAQHESNVNNLAQIT